MQNYISNLLLQSLSSVPAGDAKTKGIALGHSAALAILAKRNNDGIANANFPITEGTLPGEYRFTFPFNGPPFNGFYDSPGWGNVTPFGLSTGAQFRPVAAPYAINSVAYTADFNEVKSLGRYNSSPEQPTRLRLQNFGVKVRHRHGTELQ